MLFAHHPVQEKKKVLDKHTNLATALLGAIKDRGLDQLYNTEEDLLTGKADWPGVMRAVQVRGKGGDPGMLKERRGEMGRERGGGGGR